MVMYFNSLGYHGLLEGLSTMDPPESDTSGLTTPVTGLA